MTMQIRDAQRSSAKPLLAFYSESGGGKTRAALWLARGFVGPVGKIGMIETEAGRGEAYADLLPGGYKVLSLHGDYSPKQYGQAIRMMEQAGMDALIVDSGSHEWEGINGVLDQAASKKESGTKGMQVWTQCKIDHQKHFIGRLLQTTIPLVILCLRAKYPMQEGINPENGKKEMFRSKDLEPIQSADILYDVFCHGWFDKEKHNFHATNYLRPDLADVIRDGHQVGIETGEALAKWSKGIYGVQSKELRNVLMAIDLATTMAELESTAVHAGKLSEDEKKVAKTAYARKGGSLKPPE